MGKVVEGKAIYESFALLLLTARSIYNKGSFIRDITMDEQAKLACITET